MEGGEFHGQVKNPARILIATTHLTYPSDSEDALSVSLYPLRISLWRKGKIQSRGTEKEKKRNGHTQLSPFVFLSSIFYSNLIDP